MVMLQKASVVLVDDHPLLRKGLRQLLSMSEGIEVVAEAGNGEDAITLAIELDPDLILLDLNMQGMHGLETLRRLREAEVTSRIVILTVSDSDEDVLSAISAGADGYLLKDMEPEEMLAQIERAMSGKMVLSESITQVLAMAIRNKPNKTSNTNDLLTQREMEILGLIAKGLSNKHIARELDISDGTVKVHVKHLLKKLHLRSRVEAAIWMINQQA
jgi:two-component system, NarL family, nitrate/nitrite response regulator NarL